MTFKKGDLVRCVDNKNVERKLELGKMYKVLNVSDIGTVCVSNGTEYWYSPDRFELANPESQYIGQRAMFLNSKLDDWKPRILVAILPKGRKFKYCVVSVLGEECYENGEDYAIDHYMKMKPIPETVTIKIGDFEKEVTACDAEKIKAYAEGVEG